MPEPDISGWTFPRSAGGETWRSAMNEDGMRIFRNPSPNAVHPPVTGYHHQVEVGSWRRWVVLSGQVGVQPDGQVPQDPIEQLVVALENVRQNLFAADLRVDDVVKLTFHLVGDVDKQRLHEVVAGWLAGHAPAMTMLFVAGLAEPGYRVQVEVWAAH